MTRPADRGRPSTDELHRTLLHARRRNALRCLERVADWMSLERLARQVSALETVDESEPPDQESVQVTLHHVHLPLLADVGLVEYDVENGRVRPEPSSRQRTAATDRD